ncbi:MAG: hypothetical protein EBX41_09360 [Chitinophagia bacterium]|nr:hypothetical protein [Chitinophagia bacterium]
MLQPSIKKIILIVAAIICSNALFAQYSEFLENAEGPTKFTLSSDNNTLQIGGRVSGYYENRALKEGQLKKNHTGWAIKDFDINFLGRNVNKFIYEFHLSLNDLVTAAATQNTDAPDKSGIKSAYLGYRGFPVHIKFGYDKIPYSQGSMSDVWGTPLWSHAELYGGDLFSRRDFGLTLNYRFFKNRIQIYGGAYSGMGENFFEYGNDASGTFEYVARAEFSYPGKMKYHIIDVEHLEKPNFRIAVNIRTANKTQPTGEVIGTDAPGKYGIKIIDGKRDAIGFDGIFKYKGFSATIEGHKLTYKPTSAAASIYLGTPETINQSKVMAGGIATSIAYDYKPLKSTLMVMYEDVNVNDLADGKQQWLEIGYAYKVAGFQSVLKVNYSVPLTEDKVSNPLKYNSSFKIGYQVVF